MTFSKLAILSAAALSCALAMGGVRTFGWLGGPAAGQRPSPVGQEADDERAGLTRSVEKIQAEVDQTARRTDELKKELQQIRAQLTELLNTPRPAFNREAVARMAALIQPPEARAVAELADVLKRHPPLPSARQGHSLQLYLLDLLTGGTTLVVDEALPGKTFNGSAKWSHDGKRIVFAAEGLGGRHVMVLEVRDGRPSFTDLGPGTCPSFSRDDKRIAFLLNPGDVPGQEAGIWVMQSDGSERQRVGDEAGAPVWSPDGREFLMNSFSDPSVATVINLEAVRAVVVAVPGYRLFSWAKWAGPGQLVACIGTKMEGEMIALLDVRDPAGAKIIKVLWRRGPELDVFPRWPLYSPESGRCFFVGVADGNRRALYSVERGAAGRAVRMVPGDLNGLAVMDLSPDGRYLVFAANQPE